MCICAFVNSSSYVIKIINFIYFYIQFERHLVQLVELYIAEDTESDLVVRQQVDTFNTPLFIVGLQF